MSDEKNNNTFSSYLGPDFQQKLVWQLLVEPEFCKKYINEINIEYFDDPYLKRIFIIMLEYFKDNDKVPNLQNGSIDEAIYLYKSPTSVVEGEILKEKIEQIKIWNEKIINKNMLYDGDIVRKNTVAFIKQQEYRKLGEEILSKVKNGEIKKPTFNFEIEEKINKIYHIGEDENYGVDVLDNIDDVLSVDFRETIPTGIKVIDEITGNGLGRGEVGLILAPSGIGKSTLLTKVANSAFNDGKRVLQIIFEDTEKQIQRKHFTLWSKIALNEIDDNRELVKERVLEHVDKYKKQGAKLDIIRFSQDGTTLNDIKNWIQRQEKKFGYKYDMIVLDYLDCLEPNRREKDLLQSELSIIKSFEAMAADYDIPCWSAIQTNRSGFTAEIVDAHNAGGNIKRLQKSHFVMSISKPNKADNDNIANIKIIKARFAKDGYEFKDCIFNNMTLEIRITDTNYNRGLKLKKHDDEDVNNTEGKIKKINDKSSIPVDHSKISETVFNDSPTINELRIKDENGNVVIHDLTKNDEFDKENDIETDNNNKNIDFPSHPPEIDENLENSNNKSSCGSIQNYEKGSSSTSITNFDPEEFLNSCSSEDDHNEFYNNPIMERLKEKRKEILKE
ncbi:MAG: DnaB-like helicase C-terminal domain-containing protein [bacterium]